MTTPDWFWIAVLLVPPLLGPLAWFFGADSRAAGGWTAGSFDASPRPDRPSRRRAREPQRAREPRRARQPRHARQLHRGGAHPAGAAGAAPRC
ncbi:hypothetical protein [Kineococcus gypseus]|uniref:hypothetical protein n=1 Tax=Kineococcus gypseus TaxID=1637102 RepID=UPI003D7F09CE